MAGDTIKGSLHGGGVGGLGRPPGCLPVQQPGRLSLPGAVFELGLRRSSRRSSRSWTNTPLQQPPSCRKAGRRRQSVCWSDPETTCCCDLASDGQARAACAAKSGHPYSGIPKTKNVDSEARKWPFRRCYSKKTIGGQTVRSGSRTVDRPSPTPLLADL